MHSKTPLVIAGPHKKLTESWREKLAQSRMLYTSQANFSELSKRNEGVLSLEGISFDASVKTQQLNVLFSSLMPMEHIGVVDLGAQFWTLTQMKSLLSWMSGCRSIHFLRLGNAHMAYDVWSLLCQWFVEKGIFIKCLDLGQCAMSLPRVKKFASVVSTPKRIEKLDFSESKWMLDHMKAFLWAMNASPLALKRVSLGSCDTSDDAVLMLLRHISMHSDVCEIFSTGSYRLGEKALGQCLDLLAVGFVSLYACLFNKQHFSVNNLQKLYQCISTSSGLKRLAIIECDWDDQADVKPSCSAGSLGVEKIYFERSANNKVGLMSRLVGLGYVIDKEVNANCLWLKRKEQN